MSGRLAALATAVTGEVSRRSRRAFLLALAAGLLANFAFGASMLPSEFTANLLLAYALFLGAFAIVLAAVLLQQFGGTFTRSPWAAGRAWRLRLGGAGLGPAASPARRPRPRSG